MTFASPPERKDFKTDKEFEKAQKDWNKIKDDLQDEAFEDFKQGIELFFKHRHRFFNEPFTEEQEKDIILNLASPHKYEKVIDNWEYSFNYDFSERVKSNNFSRPISQWS